MKERTDTERLEWIIRHPHCSVRGSGGSWSMLDASDGLTFRARGEITFRAAIDAAMDADERG